MLSNKQVIVINQGKNLGASTFINCEDQVDSLAAAYNNATITTGATPTPRVNITASIIKQDN